jgi:NodT family efflux transporter outer membrane factor (OMF) lipoprotein
MTRTRKSRLAHLIAVSGLVFIAGCAVGPEFKRPAAPANGGYTPAPLSTTSSTSDVAGGEAQQFVEGRDIRGEWWTLFHSKPLEDLIERSLKANPDLKAAQAALLVARENVLAQRGAYYPNFSGGFSATRAKTSNDIYPVTNTSALNYSLYTPQVSVSYVPDVFGLNRRTVESLKAQEQQARFALAATHITLSANVVAGAIQEASLRAQIDATHELITINTNMLEILRTQYAKGYVSRLDVAAQESQLAQVAATLPPLLKQLAQQRDLLAILAGGFPNQELTEQFALGEFATAARTAGQPSIATRRATSRCAPSRGEPAFHQRPDWHCGCESAPELCADRGCRQHGGGPWPPIRGREWVLGRRHQRHAAHL